MIATMIIHLSVSLLYTRSLVANFGFIDSTDLSPAANMPDYKTGCRYFHTRLALIAPGFERSQPRRNYIYYKSADDRASVCVDVPARTTMFFALLACWCPFSGQTTQVEIANIANNIMNIGTVLTIRQATPHIYRPAQFELRFVRTS